MFQHLTLKPFNLDAGGIEWVASTFASLTEKDKVSQLFNLLLLGNDEKDFELVKRFKPGGFTRFYSDNLEYEWGQLSAIKEALSIPPLVSADLEGSRQSFPFGTAVPNQLSLAALNCPDTTFNVTSILAQEGKGLGINWSFTPVIDINKAFRSSIVGCRSYGSDLATIDRHAAAHIAAMQSNGVAATVKHWPGEGYDDRDQHLVTTSNPLSFEEWMETYGRLYRNSIESGVMSVMSAHIAFPAYMNSVLGEPGVEAHRPASVNYHLNQKLLREEFGFNGVIVSDATGMAGFGAWGARRIMLPEIIENGCDMILFANDLEADFDSVLNGLLDGRLSHARLNDAVIRVLGMKAALGLHKKPWLPSWDECRRSFATPNNLEIANTAISKVPTLVKDTQHLLPLNPTIHRRILVIESGINHPLLEGSPFDFVLPSLLRKEGFDVTLYSSESEMDPSQYDVILYLFGEESLLTKSHIYIDWVELMGKFGRSMERYWHDTPTMMISFGHPYYLYDAPRVPTYINAYCTLDEMQASVVEAILGRKPWNVHSPIDAFCGLAVATY
jgi:beta-N-acetylhexosaminidase